MSLDKEKKKLIYMGIFGIMVGLNGLETVFSNGNQSSTTPTIQLDIDNLDKVNLNTDNKLYYSKENTYLIFDIKTGTCHEYVLNNYINFNNEFVSEIYDVVNDKVIFSDKNSNGIDNVYYDYLKSSSIVVFLRDLEKYFPDMEVKDSYSLDEIRYLEPYIYNIILNQFENQKVLSK